MNDNRFWEYLESLPEQTAAWCEWHGHLGEWDKFSVFYQKYLKLRMNRAKTVKCRIQCECDCPRKVVENSPTDIKAVCPNNMSEPYPLEFRDILLHSLKLDKFFSALGDALELKGSQYFILALRNVQLLGDYTFEDGSVSSPVLITFSSSQEEMNKTIKQLCRLLEEPFILLAPTSRYFTYESSWILNKNKSIFLPLEDAVTFNDNGTFKLNEIPKITAPEKVS